MKKDQLVEKEARITDEYPLQKPDPEVLPLSTLWPLSMAFGVSFIFWGFIAAAGLTITGLFVTGISLAGWISDLRPINTHGIKKP
jgi:hypothetical protein